AQLRGGAEFHPVRAVVLFVLQRARRDQAARHAARSAAALPRLGVSGNAGGFPDRDRFHDVLSSGRTAAAVGPWHPDHAFRSFDLCRLPQADGSRPRGRISGSRMNMNFLRVATLAAALMLAAATSVRAQTATADDTAKFLAGMMPSADSPLMPLTT